MPVRRLLILVVLFLAGCASTTPSPSNLDDGAAAAIEPSSFLFEATDCVEGGGHSVHAKIPGYLPDPWLPADVQDDTGTPLLTTEPWAHPMDPVPEENNTMGNWHVTMMCASSTLDGRALTNHVFGYVGMRVEAPPFDTGTPVDRHYLITVVASNDAQFRERLHHLGFHATDAVGHVGVLDSGLFHNVLDTSDHGVYESYFLPEPAGAMPAKFRLWFQVENDDGTFSPVALDVLNTDGLRLRAQGGYGTFTHLETADHAPLPGAGGESPAVAYTDFDRVITPGPRPDVRLPEAYIHL